MGKYYNGKQEPIDKGCKILLTTPKSAKVLRPFRGLAVPGEIDSEFIHAVVIHYIQLIPAIDDMGIYNMQTIRRPGWRFIGAYFGQLVLGLARNIHCEYLKAFWLP